MITEKTDELNKIAAGYNLKIKYDREFRRYFVNDVNTVASLLQYTPWEFKALDAEQLESDIDEAIENYQPLEFDRIEHEKQCERPRHLYSGRFK